MENQKLFSTKQIVFGIVGLIIGILFFVLTPPEGLSLEGFRALGLFIVAIIWWMGSVFPDFVTAFFLLTSLVLFKVVPLGTAFSAWSGSVVWIVIPALAIGATLSKTGLLRRIVLKILSMFPGTFKSQVLAFLVAGNIVNPMIPSATAKVAIAAPLARTYSDEMGFEAKSKPAAGLFSAMWASFGANGPFFLTGTTMCFTMIGLLPEEFQAQWNFMRWLGAVWPWGIVLFVLSYIAIRAFYSPAEEKPLPEAYIKEQYTELGQMSRNEKITAVILVICLIMWVTESWHHVAAAVVALLGMTVLLATNVLERTDFRARIAWDAVVFVACNTGIASVFSATGITAWVGETFGVYLQPLFSNIFVLIIVSVVVISILRFIFVSQTALMTIYTVACAPFAIAAGMSPFIPGIICLVTVNVWNVVYHNATMITTIAASNDMVEFKQIQKMSIVYMVSCVVGMICCIPMWKLLGMM